MHDDSRWVVIATSAEVPDDRPVCLSFRGGHFLALRDAAGRVQLWDRRCPHLGGSLAHGTLEQGRVVCPFHGWAFGTGGEEVGRCLSTPGIAMSHQQRRKIRVTTHPVRESDGLVLASEGSLLASLGALEKMAPRGEGNLELCAWYVLARSEEIGPTPLDKAYFGSVVRLRRCGDHRVEATLASTGRQMPVVEADGRVYGWYHPHGVAPSWSIEAHLAQGDEWALRKVVETPMRGQLAAIRINGLDLGHFGPVHHGEVVADSIEVVEQGHRYTYEYDVKVGPARIRVKEEFHGLGYSVATVRGPGGWEIRIAASVVPVDGQRCVSKQYYFTRRHSRWVEPMLQAAWQPLLGFFASNIAADMVIWAHQTHTRNIAIFPEERRLRHLRTWASQFFGDDAPDEAQRA